jgi:Cu/Ag efflux pump CusA
MRRGRARLIRTAIMLSAMSALAAAILIIVIFFTALWQLEAALLIGALFILCMLCLIGALIFVILDINQSLMALKLEMAADD